MATTIERKDKKSYPIPADDLVPGRIYEGQDGLLYVGVHYYADHNVYAVGLGHDQLIGEFKDDDEQDFMFREVTAVVTIS